MAKRANASNITRGLAQLGGGSIKDGGSGMMGGMQMIFKTGVKVGSQLGLEGKDVSAVLDDMAAHFLEKK